ncbi:hypothetical protein C8R46DRAFT_1039289 [Mycena filopes]|nr:hypothetical protein C8R46DRAFT_1039289 [Mycena filopes]
MFWFFPFLLESFHFPLNTSALSVDPSADLLSQVTAAPTMGTETRRRLRRAGPPHRLCGAETRGLRSPRERRDSSRFRPDAVDGVRRATPVAIDGPGTDARLSSTTGREGLRVTHAWTPPRYYRGGLSPTSSPLGRRGPSLYPTPEVDDPCSMLIRE